MARLETVDSQCEGYGDAELEQQRDLSVKFHWGHNHDFGDFQLQGRMADRHIDLLANFISFFPVSLAYFQGKQVFDIGCWTGGTALLLAALGSNVHAIEEVKKSIHLAWLSAIAGVWAASTAFFISSSLARPFLSMRLMTSSMRRWAMGMRVLAMPVMLVTRFCQSCVKAAWLSIEVHIRPASSWNLKLVRKACS